MANVKRSAKTVSIACKLPQGLTVHLKSGRVVQLHGANSHFNIAGHGITQNVPVEDWDAIQAEHKHALWLKNGFVFANSGEADLKEEADDKADNRNGFEPIDPNKPDARSLIQPEGAQDPGEKA